MDVHRKMPVLMEKFKEKGQIHCPIVHVSEGWQRILMTKDDCLAVSFLL